MDCKIDWYSFTQPVNLSGVGHSDEAWAHIDTMLRATAGAPFVEWFAADELTPRSGRGIYGAGIQAKASGVIVWFGGTANHLLVELGGVGCSQAREAGIFQGLVEATGERCTRLDVAVDIPDAGSPAQFVAGGYNEAFKSRSSITSPDGETEYVGSPKSERFARVYRYRDPHPRAHLLRVEHVLRSHWAKAAAVELVHSTAAELAAALGSAFQWRHPLWQVERAEAPLKPSTRGERESSSTVLWLYRAVLPALKSLHSKGIIDVRAWVTDVLLPTLD